MKTPPDKGTTDRLRDLLGSPRDREGRAFPAVAEAYRRAGRLDEARESVEEGIANHPEMMSGHVVAARVFADVGDHERASDAARAALAIDPENGEAADLLASAEASLGGGADGVAAEEDGEDGPVAEEGATEEAPAQESAVAEDALAQAIGTRTLAELYVRQGHMKLAVAVYRDIVKRAPSDASARARLAELEAGPDPRAGALETPGAETPRTERKEPPRYDAESAARDLAGEGESSEADGDGVVFAWGGDGTGAERRERTAEPEPPSTPVILVVHGPNLAALGWREPLTYGNVTLPEINRRLDALGRELGCGVEVFQSNHEGEIIDRIEDARERVAGVVINPGGLTHTSVALRDALVGSGLPFVEIHISNTAGRASFRQRSLISAKAAGVVHGFGAQGYLLALRGLANNLRGPPS